MPKKGTLTTHRIKPVGDRKTGRATIPGLVFTRVRRVKRQRGFAAAPRLYADLPTAADFNEEEYQQWYVRYGGTRPEWLVWRYLVKRKKMQEGSDFIYQSPRNGGRSVFGGSVVDFEITGARLFWRVQGERFHSSPDEFAHDQIQRLLLNRNGWKVIDLWAEDIASATSRVIEAALNGQELAGPRFG